MRVLVLFIVIITLSCKTHREMDSSSPDQTAAAPELTLLLKDNYGGTEQPGIQVIRDPETLKKFFFKINKTRKPGIPVPTIDFNTQTVVVFCSGQTQSGGVPSLAIRKETDEEVLLGIKDPGKAEDDTTATIMPFGLYTIPVTDKRIIFEGIQ
jgi:hypothetical protein